MEAWELVQFVLTVAGCALIAGGLPFLVRVARRRQRAILANWEHALREAGLTSSRRRRSLAGTALIARDGELEIRLEPYQRQEGDAGTRVTIRGLTHPEGALSIRPEGLRTAVDARLLGARETELGDEAFDRECFVEGEPALALATLTAPVRREIRRLQYGTIEHASRSVPARGRIDRGTLTIEVREDGDPGAEAIDALPAALCLARALVPPRDLAGRLAANVQQEPSPAVRTRILAVLARDFADDPRTADALRAAREDPASLVRLNAALALKTEGRATLEALVADTTAEDGCRAQAIAALGPGVGVDAVEDALWKALPGRAPATAVACLDALRRFRRREAGPLIAQALGSPNTAVALAAARALGACGGVESVARLRALADGAPDAPLRAAARQAVAAIQARLLGAEPGQLSLADDAQGGLSLVDEPASAGRLSLAATGTAPKTGSPEAQGDSRRRLPESP